jgi:hypothetical protein
MRGELQLWLEELGRETQVPTSCSVAAETSTSHKQRALTGGGDLQVRRALSFSRAHGAPLERRARGRRCGLFFDRDLQFGDGSEFGDGSRY